MVSNSLLLAVSATVFSLLHPSGAAAYHQAEQQLLGDTSLAQKTNSRPNIVFVLTDDQDARLNSLEYQPLIKKHLRAEGTTFTRHFCTIAICCPSRVNLWTGKAGHNTNVTDINPPYGGYPKFVSQGLNDDYLFPWLQQAGYNTYYTGKLFNAHTVDNYDKPYPKGFNGSDFLLDPYTYQYLNSTFQRNQEPPVNYPGEYSTDLVAERAYNFIDEALTADSDNPFFLAIAPVACHSNVVLSGAENLEDMLVSFGPPISAERHQHLFQDVRVPRTENFNPESPSGVNWIRELPRLNDTVVDHLDHFYRQRLRALQAVDEMVEGVVQRLEQYGVLDNTYIIYTTDNGYHVGQHRMQAGKECGFEEDIDIPLIIRGPGIPQNFTSDIVTTHTDLAPTIFKMIGLPHKDDFDGIAIPTTEKGLEEAKIHRHEHVNVEFWGLAAFETEYAGKNNFFYNNTYKGLRIVGETYNFYYSVWCNNVHELYDLNQDPYQMNNILLKGSDSSSLLGEELLGFPVAKVVSRLDSLLFVLKSCKGGVCVRPWEALHPEGNVQNLQDALASRFDSFYEVEQQRVEFSRCEFGHILDAEGPQFEVDGLIYRNGQSWHQWV